MRLKRNIVTSIFAGVFILIALLGIFQLASSAYDRFSADGMHWIFLVLFGVAVLLFFIGCFFLRENAKMRFLQDEKAGLIIAEGIISVALVGITFFNFMSTSVEAAIWISGFLVLTFAVCRIMGGRICGLAGLGFTFFLVFFILGGEWYPFSTDDMTRLYSVLIPFLVFLIMTKYIIPQFAKNSAIVVVAVLILAAIFGTAIVINPVVLFLAVGCVVALLFSRIRTVDTTVTRGPVMAVIFLVLSAGCTFGMSILLEKDFASLFSFTNNQAFEEVMSSGDWFTFIFDRFGDMFNITHHSFDYSIYPLLLMVLTAIGGLAAIRRKLSPIGPMLLLYISTVIGYMISAEPGANCVYADFLPGIFAAYGLFYLFLPEFLSKFEDDDSSDAYEVDDVKPMAEAATFTVNPEPVNIAPMPDSAAQNSALNNMTAPDSAANSGLSGNAASQNNINGSTDPGVGADMKKKTPPPTLVPAPTPTHQAEDTSSFFEWHVSEEFVREDKLKKERQAARERSYQMAKEREAAKERGEEVPEFIPEQIPTIVDTLEEEKPSRVVYVEQEIGNTHAPVAPPVYQEKEDEPQYNVLGFKEEDPEQSLKSAFKPDSDTIIMSGYQHKKSSANPDLLDSPTEPFSTFESFAPQDLVTNPLHGTDPDPLSSPAADLLTAINGAEVPTVEIPDVPPAGEAVTKTAIAGAPDAGDELASVAKDFVGDGVDKTVMPGEDEQLDNLLERLDMSDSIKRMNASARADMADVIEHPVDPTEAEVVLDSRDYNFGNDDGEYGEVPTVSDLEDKWRAEEQLQATPETEIPDVVSAEETAEIHTENVNSTDGMMGFDFTGFGVQTDFDSNPESEFDNANSTVSAGVPESEETGMFASESDSLISSGVPESEESDPYSDGSEWMFDAGPNDDKLGADVGKQDVPEGILGEGTGLAAYPEGILGEGIGSNISPEDMFDMSPQPDRSGGASEMMFSDASESMFSPSLQPDQSGESVMMFSDAPDDNLNSTMESDQPFEPDHIVTDAPELVILPTPEESPAFGQQPFGNVGFTENVDAGPAPIMRPDQSYEAENAIKTNNPEIVQTIENSEKASESTYSGYNNSPGVSDGYYQDDLPPILSPYEPFGLVHVPPDVTIGKDKSVAEPEPAVSEAPAIEPISEPEPVMASEPVFESVPEPTIEPIPEPEPVMASEPVFESVSEPTIEPIAEPEPVMAAEPVFESIPEPEPVAPAPEFKPTPASLQEVQPESVPVSVVRPEPVVAAAPEFEPILKPFNEEPAAETSTVFEPAPELAAETSMAFEPAPELAVEPTPIFETAPEPAVEPAQVYESALEQPSENFESMSFKDMASRSVRKFEPERIERPTAATQQEAPEIQPVVNHTNESPVYTFTSKDVNIDVAEEEKVLGIPKPGRHSYKVHHESQNEDIEERKRPFAAELDHYDWDMKQKPIHTEEVVTRTVGGTRSYHKIIIK